MIKSTVIFTQTHTTCINHIDHFQGLCGGGDLFFMSVAPLVPSKNFSTQACDNYVCVVLNCTYDT